MNKNLTYLALEDEEMIHVVGGGTWHWGDEWGDPGYWGLTPGHQNDGENEDRK